MKIFPHTYEWTQCAAAWRRKEGGITRGGGGRRRNGLLVAAAVPLLLSGGTWHSLREVEIEREGFAHAQINCTRRPSSTQLRTRDQINVLCDKRGQGDSLGGNSEDKNLPTILPNSA